MVRNRNPKEDALEDSLINSIRKFLGRKKQQQLSDGEVHLLNVHIIDLDDPLNDNSIKDTFMICSSFTQGYNRISVIKAPAAFEINTLVNKNILNRPEDWELLAFCILNKTPMTELTRKLYTDA